ncbi:magnesium-dependent phosphatase-1 [Mycena floridula]|nr:magnesium-dependent phosphatase-1 [Mycena floridula]
MSDTRLPKLVAFDLDYTLWDLWIDTHVTAPLRRDKNAINEVLDKHGYVVAFYPDAPEILQRLRDAGVILAACSRTSATALARQALSLLLMPPKDKDSKQLTATQYFDQQEIYPGSKLTHFRKIHEKTGIPYEEMLFFDDESRNKEVEKLGVTMHLIRHGVSNQAFEIGLATWRKRHPAPPVESED